MMFPHAAKGVKKIFTAEILALIGTVLLGVATTAFLAVGEDRLGENTGLSVTVLIGFLAGGVLALIALIFKLIGVIQTSMDEPAFKGVLYVTIFSMIVSAFATTFSYNLFISSVASGVSAVAELVTIVLIIVGVCHMADHYDRKDMMQRGGRILRIVLWLAVLSIIMRFISIFLPRNFEDANDLAKFIVIGLAVLSVMLSIAEYALYLAFLSKAKKMLGGTL